MQKVRDAASYLAEAGEAGLASFRGKGSAYVWKGSCVFVSDCDKGILLAHRPGRSARDSHSRPALPMAA